MATRRDFLASSLSLIGGLVANTAFAELAHAAPSRRLAISEEFVAAEWAQAMTNHLAHSGSTADRAFWQAFMAARSAPGTTDAPRLLALPAPGVEPFEPAQARELAVAVNNRLAEEVRAGSGIAGLATVSAFDPGAAHEAERAIYRLGLSGIALGANRGLRLDHASLRPLYEFAQSAGVMVYLPAAYAPLAGDAPYRAANRAGVLMGASADSAAHAEQLIHGGVLKAFPRLKVTLGRLGDGAPYWAGRLMENSDLAVRSFANNIHLTTVDVTTPEAMAFCVSITGAQRMMAGHGSTLSA